jgi:hypothetical protein
MQKKITGNFCASCGTYQVTKSYWVAAAKIKFRLWQSESFRHSPLEHEWKHYLGGCRHDWHLAYINWQSAFGKGFGDSFAAHNYPAASMTVEIAEANKRLQPESARAQCLRAIGTPNNFLRFVAADALLNFFGGTNENHSFSPSTKDFDCLVQSFQICTNKAEAQKILDILEGCAGDRFSWGIDQARDILQKSQ